MLDRLEDRLLLSADGSFPPAVDTNQDGLFQPYDALILLNSVSNDTSVDDAPQLDLNGDGQLSTADVDLIIGSLNSYCGGDWDAESIAALDDVTLAISDTVVSEGAAADVMVSLVQPTAEPVEVMVWSEGGTANAYEDFEATYVYLLFEPGGPTSQTVSVATMLDGVNEGDETFLMRASRTGGTTPAEAVATVTLQDVELDLPSLSVIGDSVHEGDSATVTLTLASVPATDLFITVWTADGTATGYEDYESLSTDYYWIAGDPLSQTFTIPTVADAVSEGDEAFTVYAGVGLIGATGSPVESSGSITILDGDSGDPTGDDPTGDAPTSTITVSDVTVSEGDSATVTVTLSSPPSEPLSLYIGSESITATEGSDYDYVFDYLTFEPDGELTQTVAVTTFGDNEAESDETFRIVVTNSETDESVTGIVTIADVSPPTVSISSVTVSEGATAEVQVTLSSLPAEAMDVYLNISGGTASSGIDYTSFDGFLTFAPDGSVSQTLNIQTILDQELEPNETVVLESTGPSNEIETGVVTILDVDPLSVGVNFGSSSDGNSRSNFNSYTSSPDGSLSIPEGETLLVNLWLSGNPSESVTFFVDTEALTATPGIDYGYQTDSLTINPGQSLTHSLEVPIHLDEISDDGEQFRINVTNSETFDTFSRTITIEDLAPPSVSVTGGTVAEGETGTFTVALSHAPHGLFLVAVDLPTGTATEDLDYQFAGVDHVGGIRFQPDGPTSQTIVLEAISDGEVEPDETVDLRFHHVDTNTDITATVTITSEDVPPPTFSVAAESGPVIEGEEAALTVTLSHAPSEPFVLDVATVAGTATEGLDYSLETSYAELTFNPDDPLTKTVLVNTASDNLTESDETFVVRVTDETSNTSIDETVTIEDVPPPSVSISGVTVSEGEVAQLTVTLSHAPAAELSLEVDSQGGSAERIFDFEHGANGEGISDLLFLPGGSLSQTIEFSIVSDDFAEPEEEFQVSVANYTNSITATGTVTILSDTPEVRITSDWSDLIAYERSTAEDRQVRFTVDRTGNVNEALTVEVSVSGTAVWSQDGFVYDYTLTNVVDGWTMDYVTIPADERSIEVVLEAVEDSFDEAPTENGYEKAYISLLDADDQSYEIHPYANSVDIEIRNSTTVVSVIAIDEMASTNGDNPGRFVVYRTGDLTDTLEVKVEVTGTATWDQHVVWPASYDYTTSNLADNTGYGYATVTIPSGQAYVAIDVDPVVHIEETNADAETVELTVLRYLGTTPYDLGESQSATVQIQQDAHVFDVSVFRQLVEDIDPHAAAVLNQGNAEIVFGTAEWLILNDGPIGHEGTVADQNLVLRIDPELMEFDAAVRFVHYCQDGGLYVPYWTQVLGGADLDANVQAMEDYREHVFGQMAEYTANGVAAYLGVLSVFNEGVDVVYSVYEISQGNWWGFLGLLPFVPAAGVKVVDQLGNTKVLDNALVRQVQDLIKVGDNAQAQRLIDDLPSSNTGLPVINDILGIGGCFVPGTLVTLNRLPENEWIAHVAGHDFRADRLCSGDHDACGSLLLDASTVSAQAIKVPIEHVPLGARVPTENPRWWEQDDSLPEPDEATWAVVSFTTQRNDGQMIDGEILRPRSWIEHHGIEPGQRIPIRIEELQVEGFASVHSVKPPPHIATGDGSAVTGRFVTREVNVIARVEVVGADGQTETIEGTTVHPIWSLDRNDWVALGEIEEGEELHGSEGPVTVLTHAILQRSSPVYNLEVHGQHVYQVGKLGLLVHNACNPLRANMIAEYGHPGPGWQAAHIIPQTGWDFGGEPLRRIIKRAEDKGLLHDVANGFWSYSPSGTYRHSGTHTKKYVDDVIEIMENKTSRESMINGINELWALIKAGKYETP